MYIVRCLIISCALAAPTTSIRAIDAQELKGVAQAVAMRITEEAGGFAREACALTFKYPYATVALIIALYYADNEAAAVLLGGAMGYQWLIVGSPAA